MSNLERQLEKFDIDSPFPLTREHIRYYQENGYIKLKNVLTPETLEFYRKEITGKVLELNTMHLPMGERTTYQKAFLQVSNIYEHSESVRRFVLGKRLGRIAAELMTVKGVRLYHDQALYKEGSGGLTPWHADQYYWPLASNKSVTVWIPLQQTPLEMGPLAFSVGSQKIKIGRNLEISDESEATMRRELANAGLPEDEGSFDLGEVSFHSGWTFHHARNNTTGRTREVMTIIYIDKEMRLAEPVNANQESDWHTWCPGVEIGEEINSPLNPIIYSPE
jgi:ectoine hydroxylase-related dioxygenase (phytanoyl-CoA dioxygenase family)